MTADVDGDGAGDEPPPSVEVSSESGGEEPEPSGDEGDGSELACGVCGPATAASGGAGVAEGGDAAGAPFGGRRVLRQVPSAAPPGNLRERGKEVESQSQKEEEFGRYFGRLVSEWNPCFDEDGRPYRYLWDEEVGAHDVEVLAGEGGGASPQPREPERYRLRELLDEVLRSVEAGGVVDLDPVRALVGRLVQSSARHVHRGGSMEPPKFGRDA